MNILLFDPYLPKFTDGMQKWWTQQGHEVKAERYYNPSLVDWADVIWFETTDNNILSATNPGAAILDDPNNYQPWAIQEHDLTGKRVVCRMIDIEVWQQHYMAVNWAPVTDIIFIAPHIRNLVEVDAMTGFYEGLKVHVIPCAVDLDKWTYREHKPGFNIAVVAERWASKGTSEILQIAYKLKQIDKRYKITWLGQRSDYQWEHAYRDEFVEHHGLNIEFVNHVESVDEFLEDKDYLLSGSHKEAFGYNIAEAMAKGIRPIVHRFYGADDLWPGMTWSGIDEAIDMITDGTYDSASYRQYLVDHNYTLDSMMESFNKVIKGE